MLSPYRFVPTLTGTTVARGLCVLSALVFLVRDRGRGRRTARALALRVGLSLALFVLLIAGFASGLITQRL